MIYRKMKFALLRVAGSVRKLLHQIECNNLHKTVCITDAFYQNGVSSNNASRWP